MDCWLEMNVMLSIHPIQKSLQFIAEKILKDLSLGFPSNNLNYKSYIFRETSKGLLAERNNRILELAPTSSNS